MAELVNISQPKLLDKVPQSVSYGQQREGGIAMDERFSATVKVLWAMDPGGYSRKEDSVHCHEIIYHMRLCIMLALHICYMAGACGSQGLSPTDFNLTLIQNVE